MRLWTELYGLNTASSDELYFTGWVLCQVKSWIYRVGIASSDELYCTEWVLRQVTS
jgi:hypothetical protein